MTMSDMLLKQKPKGLQWQTAEMIRRPWPPMFRAPLQRVPPFNFRPVEQSPWREQTYHNGYHNSFASPQTNKSRDYYFLAPYYRNVMPPPPKPQKDRLLVVDPMRRRSSKREERPICHCKSRSMEDVRFDVVEVTPEWEHDENGNRIGRTKNFGVSKPYRQHSMENLLMDNGYTPPSKRNNRFKVFIYCFQSYFLLKYLYVSTCFFRCMIFLIISKII